MCESVGFVLGAVPCSPPEWWLGFDLEVDLSGCLLECVTEACISSSAIF
jgi:hypothetical protein